MITFCHYRVAHAHHSHRQDRGRFIDDVAKGKTATVVKTEKHGRAVVKGGKGTATRTAGLLSGIFACAVELGPIQTNPVHGVKRRKDKRNDGDGWFVHTPGRAMNGRF